MKTRIKISDIETILQYATSVALLVVSGTPLNSVYYGLTIVLYLAMTVLLYFCVMSRHNSYRIKQAHGVFFLIGVISLLVTMVINKDQDTGHYLGIIIQLAAAVLYVNVISGNPLSFGDGYLHLFGNPNPLLQYQQIVLRNLTDHRIA